MIIERAICAGTWPARRLSLRPGRPPPRPRDLARDDARAVECGRSISNGCAAVQTAVVLQRLGRERDRPWSVGVIASRAGRYDHGNVGDLGLVKLVLTQGRWWRPPRPLPLWRGGGCAGLPAGR